MPLHPHRRERNQVRQSVRWPGSKRLKKRMRKRPSEGRHRSCEASKLVLNGCINDRNQVSKDRRPRLLLASGRLSSAAKSLHLFRLRRAGARGGTPSAHKRKPPRKALAFSPARHRAGRAPSFVTLPPPITVSSGRSAALRRSTTSAT